MISVSIEVDVPDGKNTDFIVISFILNVKIKILKLCYYLNDK
jgi:hypothetical protein